MITDEQTNTVYVSELFKRQHPRLYRSIGSMLKEESIALLELKKTKDIWCCDYMPVQIKEDEFVLFNYDPDYLKDEYTHLRSDQKDVISQLSIKVTKSELVIDGGNIVRNHSRVIMTDKIFEENPLKTKEQVIQELRYFLDVEEVIIVPKVPDDYTGHADGMLRFVNHNTVLLNDFTRLGGGYLGKLKKSLTAHGLKITLLPWDGWKQEEFSADIGDYINFLHVGNLIIVPEFKQPTDEAAKNAIRHCFPKAKIKGLECTELAMDGGIFHCCTWNTKT